MWTEELEKKQSQSACKYWNVLAKKLTQEAKPAKVHILLKT